MTHDLKTSLEDLAEAEYAGAPASTIDIGRARAAGRRRMLTARLAPVGGGVAVAVACVLVANALGGTSPAGHGPRPADSSPAGRPELTGTDPLRAVAKFGWLPEGFQVAGHGTGPFYGTSVTAQTEPQPSGAAGGSMPVKLTVTSSAAEPTLPSYETRKKVTVAGSPNAYLVTNPGDGPSVPADLSLRWQTASGSWFTLGGDYQIHGDPLQALLIRVAESVTADDSAVPLPFHIEGLPKDAILGEATLNNPVTVGGEGFQAQGTSQHALHRRPGLGGPRNLHRLSVDGHRSPAVDDVARRLQGLRGRAHLRTGQPRQRRRPGLRRRSAGPAEPDHVARRGSLAVDDPCRELRSLCEQEHVDRLRPGAMRPRRGGARASPATRRPTGSPP